MPCHAIFVLPANLPIGPFADLGLIGMAEQ
jgi:hypothetical protein